jgi:hypothetical protein
MPQASIFFILEDTVASVTGSVPAFSRREARAFGAKESGKQWVWKSMIMVFSLSLFDDRGFVCAKGGVFFVFAWSTECLFLRKAMFFRDFLFPKKESHQRKTAKGLWAEIFEKSKAFFQRFPSPFPLDPQHPFLGKSFVL